MSVDEGESLQLVLHGRKSQLARSTWQESLCQLILSGGRVSSSCVYMAGESLLVGTSWQESLCHAAGESLPVSTKWQENICQLILRGRGVSSG
jgi:hypothetical protein